MAATKQTLELELMVKSEGFKGQLLEAQRNLLELEKKALKAGKANQTLGKKIKQAKIAVRKARNEYNLATNALKQHAVQARATATATVNLGKGQKRSNMAMTQAAYALDDMQYGFQGVQNNIQAMAVSMGAGGPLIVGLTLLTIGIGLMVKKFQKAGKEAKKLKEELSEKQGLVASMMVAAEVVKNTTEGTEEHTKAMKDLTKNGYKQGKMAIDDYVAALQEQMFIEAKLAANKKAIQDNLVQQLEIQEEITKLTKNGPAKRASSAGSGVMGGGAQLNQNDLDFQHATKLSGAKDELKVLQDQLAEKLKISVQDRKQLEAIRVKGKATKEQAKESGENDGAVYSHGFLKSVSGSDMQGMWFKNLNQGIKESIELMKAQGMSKEDIIQSELDALEASNLSLYNLEDQEAILHRIQVLKAKLANMPGMQDSGVGLTADDQKFEKFKADLLEVQSLMENGVISFDEYIRRVENLSEAFDNLTVKKEETSAADQILNDGIGNLISGFAQAAASGGNIGQALLSGIGNTLVQLGGLLIMTGLGIEAFKASLSTLQGPVAIAAGIAMVAAGAAFSMAAKKAGGGGGGGGSSRGSVGGSKSVVRPNPVRENARVRNSNLIIPMDKMRYGMQGADDNYSGFN